MSRVLVAGVGNVFAGDDGFGCEVARRLSACALAANVSVIDFGIRSLHLAYHLLEDWDRVIFLDAVARAEAPGTVYLIDLDAAALENLPTAATADAHGTDLGTAIGMARGMGAKLQSMLLVGCEPLDLDERMGLSAPVERAVAEAARRVLQLIQTTGEPTGGGGPLPGESPGRVDP